jgi:uncharacterized protein YtpQ (UPF0354 family)
MNLQQLRLALERQTELRKWQTSWDREKDVLHIHFDTEHKPFLISLRQVLERLEEEKRDPDQVVEELMKQIEIVAEAAKTRPTINLMGREHLVYPVLRSTSFPLETKRGEKLVYEPHTAESRIYYALDLGQSYTLIDQEMVSRSGWTEQSLKERALFNLRRLDNKAKRDRVAENDFYFISPQDGYAASRILNQSLLEEYALKAKGELCLAIPHQDVLVVADIVNERGYDILQQLTLTFYRQGDIPITMLPFEYKEGMLNPIFILAERKTGRERHES